MARRLLRGLLWGVVVGVGLGLGLLLGGHIQDIGGAGSMATMAGLIGGGAAAVLGVAVPMRPLPETPAGPGDAVVDLRQPAEPVLDLTAPAPARRPRPLRPRTPSE